VSLNDPATSGNSGQNGTSDSSAQITYASTHLLPGPPFLFGAVLATLAIFVTWLIPSPHKPSTSILVQTSTTGGSISNLTATTSGSAAAGGLSLLKQKDSTIVKLGNTSATYNRTGSNSSLLAPLASNKINESNSVLGANGSSSALLVESSSGMISESLASDYLTYKMLQEKEGLLASQQQQHQHHTHHQYPFHRGAIADHPSEMQLLLNAGGMSTQSMSLLPVGSLSTVGTVQTATSVTTLSSHVTDVGGLIERSATPPQTQHHQYERQYYTPTSAINSNSIMTNSTTPTVAALGGSTGLVNQAFTNTLGKQLNLAAGGGSGILGGVGGSASNIISSGIIGAVSGVSGVSNTNGSGSTSHVNQTPNVKFKLNLD
jgi:hypothetical protein